MTDWKKLVLIVALVMAMVAAVAVLWFRATDRLEPGQSGPIMAVITLVLLATVLWATRRRASMAGK